MSAVMDIEVTSGDGSIERTEEKPRVVAKATETPKVEPKEPDDEPVAKADTTEVTQDPDDDEDDGEGDTVPRSRYEARLKKKDLAINAKHRQWKEQEEISRELFSERKAAQERVKELETQLEQTKSQAAKAPEKTREDFKTDEEWIDYRADLKVQAAEAKRQQAQLDAALAERRSKVGKRNEDFAKVTPDWAEATAALNEVASSEGLDIQPQIEDFFYESDHSAAILYKLGKDPDRLKQILSMKSPARALKALWEMDAELTKPVLKDDAKADAPARLSKAPPPITPHTENSAPRAKEPVKMETDEYIEYYERKQAEKRRRGYN